MTIYPAMRRYLRLVTVNDKMQRGYRYALVVPTGRNFDPAFRPELTPKKMLELGVFCGKYMTDCRKEFPTSWFTRAKLSPSGRDCSLNYFGVDASQPLSVWRNEGWIIHLDDPRRARGKPQSRRIRLDAAEHHSSRFTVARLESSIISFGGVRPGRAVPREPLL